MQQEFHTKYFVERGTFMGESAALASEMFEEVYTIELSPKLHEEAKERYRHKKNIHFLQGESTAVLKNVLGEITSPAIFWLDAHYSGGVTTGEQIECPLLNEIELILSANEEHLLLIDDAREILTCPPERSRKCYNLPSYKDVLTVLERERERERERRYSIIWRDVLISVPQDKSEALHGFISAYDDVRFCDFYYLCFRKGLKDNLKNRNLKGRIYVLLSRLFGRGFADRVRKGFRKICGRGRR
jgi:hypothetical protein